MFPNAQGGPLINQVAAKAVCFLEASTPEFHVYATQIIRNASAMAAAVQEAGARVVSGGTDNHLFLIDLRSVDEDLTGRVAARLLDELGITLNFNTIPFDPRPPYRASGLRIGTPAMTSQGMTESEAGRVGSLIVRALQERHDQSVLTEVAGEVSELASSFPPYPNGFRGYGESV